MEASAIVGLVRLRRRNRNARPKRRATPQIGPTTAPAIAAPEMLWLLVAGGGGTVDVCEMVVVVDEDDDVVDTATVVMDT